MPDGEVPRGNKAYENFLRLQKSKPNSVEARKAAFEAENACNFQDQPGMPSPGPFDAFRFDRAEAQARLNAAFNSPQSSGRCKQVWTPLQSNGMDFMNDHYKGRLGEKQVRAVALSLSMDGTFMRILNCELAYVCAPGRTSPAVLSTAAAFAICYAFQLSPDLLAAVGTRGITHS